MGLKIVGDLTHIFFSNVNVQEVKNIKDSIPEWDDDDVDVRHRIFSSTILFY